MTGGPQEKEKEGYRFEWMRDCLGNNNLKN
jgi:hypothetical protein